jgi:preprotein translocase subunit SecF
LEDPKALNRKFWELFVKILKGISVDWLGKKWYFFGLSWILALAGIAGYFMRGGLAWGIDFTGGTIIYLKFSQKPDLEKIRKSLEPEAATPPQIQSYDVAEKNTVQVRMQTIYGTGKTLEAGHGDLQDMLRKVLDPEHAVSAQMDFNNAGLTALHAYLLQEDPDSYKSQSKTSQEIDSHYQTVAQALLDYRNKAREGLVTSFDELDKAEGVSGNVIQSLKKGAYIGPFAVKGVDSVGAVVGQDLRTRAELAVGLSFLGMLVYIGFRFKPIYGVGGIIALFHDLIITVGLFALTQKEISLTVIAALLTLIGYSMNDTIVVFDRAREELRLQRKESIYNILNLSVNRTLSRTIMTSGTTFVSVFALFLFGGEVLNGFSFALTIGIIIGTYSSIAIATPIVEWWYRKVEQKTKLKPA